MNDKTGDRPNILIFMTDQQQAGAIEPGKACRLPHIERMAAEGVRFTRAYTPTAHCCPTRATMMTGLYPSRHGIFNNVLNEQALNTSLASGVELFSERLRTAGYDLAYAGKWHVCADENPGDRGWRELEVTAGGRGSAYHGRSFSEFRAQDVDGREAPERCRGEILRPGWGPFQLYGSYSACGEEPAYRADSDYDIVRAGIRGLEELAEGEAPWCLFIGTSGPHDPYIVPEEYAALYAREDVQLPASYSDTLEDKPRIYMRQRQQLWDQLGEDEVREAVAHYWGYCRMLDDMFGEVLDALEATGQRDDTLVLFISDHGDYCGAHGLFLKGIPAFDEAYRVPCVVRWPRGIADPGRSVEEFVTHADIAPTLLEIAGVEPPAMLSGRSLAPFFTGQIPEAWPDAFYSQMNGVELYYSQRMVQTARWKYVFNGFDFDELYDLASDPLETENLIHRRELEGVKRELIRKLWRHAIREEDGMHNPYPTVGLMPYGPSVAWEED